jgi:hypothetical protein
VATVCAQAGVKVARTKISQSGATKPGERERLFLDMEIHLGRRLNADMIEPGIS